MPQSPSLSAAAGPRSVSAIRGGIVAPQRSGAAHLPRAAHRLLFARVGHLPHHAQHHQCPGAGFAWPWLPASVSASSSSSGEIDVSIGSLAGAVAIPLVVVMNSTGSTGVGHRGGAAARAHRGRGQRLSRRLCRHQLADRDAGQPLRHPRRRLSLHRPEGHSGRSDARELLPDRQRAAFRRHALSCGAGRSCCSPPSST